MTNAFGSSKLDTWARIVLQVTLFLTPIFFIPSTSVPLQTGKSAVILFGIVLTLLLWLIARLRDGVFEIPRTLLYLAAAIFAVVYALASFFSSNPGVSLMGQSFDMGTLAFFLPSLILFALVPVIIRNEKQIFSSYTILFVSFVIGALFHVIRFIGGPGALSFGVLTDVTSNLIGKWNDVSIFFGLGALMSLITLERTTLSRFFKIVVYAVLGLSTIMLIVVNFTPVWITLGILSLVFFIYELSFGKNKMGGQGLRVPYHALAVLVISVIFIFFGQSLTARISNMLGTSQVEVRPSWSATLDISKSALGENPILGAGPNRFASTWLMHKPAGINNTLFWNTNFNYGIGFIPTLVATTGILGILAALFFIGLFVWTTIKALLKDGVSPFSRYLVLSSLFASIYLWIFSVIYVPSSSLWILTLVLSGLFISALREDKGLETRTIVTTNRPAASFVSVLVIILAIIGSASFMYVAAEKLVAATYFQSGIVALNTSGNLDKGEASINNAISLSPADTYHQSLAELYLVRLNNLFNDKEVTQAEAQSKFQTLLAGAITEAQKAVALDTTNYQNHLMLGRVFEAVVPLNIEGAYDNAKKSYEAALALNPDSPEIYLILARLEVAHKDSTAAKDFIAKALQKKGDYADAIYLLAQIQIAENDVDNAIKSVSAVATLSPSDPGIFFQLGLLYYSKRDYQTATLSFERAVSLNPQYANAKYFLGLSYYLTGAKDKSLAQFRDLEKSNPDNADVQAAIANLEAGQSPVPAPASTAVNQSSLPVKQ